MVQHPGVMMDGAWLDSSHMEYLSLHKHVRLISHDGLDSNRITIFENINVPVVSSLSAYSVDFSKSMSSLL